MITKWKVSNFKSIRDETELDLSPLTIFAGANSSGKSTFIQSILIIAQTLAYKVGSRSVVLNGTLTSLGQFDDLKSNDADVDQITIKCTCRRMLEQNILVSKRFQYPPRGSFYYGQRSNSIQEVACELSFDAGPSDAKHDLFQIQPRLFATTLSCVYKDEDCGDQKAEISIQQSSEAFSANEKIKDLRTVDEQLLDSLAYTVELDESSMMEVKEEFRSAKPVGCKLRHFLPDRIVFAIDSITENANAITIMLQEDLNRSVALRRNSMVRQIIFTEEIISVLREILEGTIDFDQAFINKNQEKMPFSSKPEKFTLGTWNERLHNLPREERLKVVQVFRDRDDLFERIYSALKGSTVENSGSLNFIPVRLPRLLMEATLYLDSYFASSLKYLGPLRDAPKPMYPLAPAVDPYDVGLRGEHTASILELHKNKKIRYMPSTDFKDPVIDRKIVTRTLESAVIDWLQYLGVASSVKSRDQGKLGHELKVGLPNSRYTHDLTHVGVGVSQVLPILVMCLLADTDTTMVFEQPELHLHPKVQTLLGDFFLSMGLCNKQCIVETHSEYLIDRLRFRIAAATHDNGLNNLSKIYFVEKTSKASSFREVVINEFGAISDWPEGFFDQSQQQAEEILRAAAKKRKDIRRKNDV